MRIIDITAPLGPTTPVYPGDPPVVPVPLTVAGGAGGFALSG
jgi:kynurenine formamidase